MGKGKKTDAGAKRDAVSGKVPFVSLALIGRGAEYAFKSCGIRIYDSMTNTARCANLIKEGAVLPARTTFLKHCGISSLTAGERGEMIDEFPMAVLENFSHEDIVPEEECDEPYETPIPFDGPILDSTLIDIEFKRGRDQQLKLTLIEVETGKRHAMHLKRKGGLEPADGVKTNL